MSRIKKVIQNTPESTVIIAMIGIMLVVECFNKNFLTFANFSAMLKSIPFIALTALGLAFTITVGEIDISVGRLAGLVGMVFGWIEMSTGNLPLAILAGLGVGLLTGLLNAVLSQVLGINSFIVTMGTMYIVGGVRYLINNSNAITLPEEFRNFSQQSPAGVSWFFWIVVLIYVIVGFIQKKSDYGRYCYAVGSNAAVANLHGVNVRLIKMSSFVLASLFSSMAGIMATIDINSSQPATGTGWEFKCVAACCIGGISLSGGAGRAFGVAVGIFVVFIISNLINMIGISNYYSDVFTGLILGGAVLVDVLRKSKKIKATD